MPPRPRRSSRVRNRPRNPDSPVSFAMHAQPEVTMVEDSSESDTEANTGTVNPAPEEVVDESETEAYNSRSPSPDVFVDSGRGRPASGVRYMIRNLRASVRQDSADLRELGGDVDSEDDGLNPQDAPTIASVNDGQGSFQDQADRLVAHIRRLQPHTAAPVSTSGSTSPTRSPAAAATISQPRAPLGEFSAVQAPDPQGAERAALYFVGIQTLTSCRSFCQSRVFIAPDVNNGGIFHRLQLAGGPVGRALSAITEREHFYVGTSDYPTDIRDDYSNHRFNFRELGALQDIEANNGADTVFLPVPFSAARSALVQSQRANENIDVYVLYVYHEEADAVRAPAPDQSHQTPLPPTALPLAITAPVPAVTEVAEYLLTRFPSEYEELARWRAASYGSAYTHCLIERQVMRICQSLGISLFGRAPVAVGVLLIRLEDVVSAAGINPQTFTTYRTELRQMREAHIILRRLQRAGTLPPAYSNVLDWLEVMLSDRILPAPDPAVPMRPSTEVDFAAVHLSIGLLMGQVRQVIEVLANA
ncbi:hypothetical protein C8R46DRAFT_1029152 [Mycena filopes]|nr:hypothetical protein C8R46DRAFT_1029152 [Mycena filopes]